MKPTLPLISAFRAVAHKLETDPSIYNWNSSTRCNCGLLAQELGVTADEIEEESGSWNHRANCSYCTITGLPLTLIFHKLSQFGLEQKDYHMLESGFDNYGVPKVVAAQFHVWANQLENQLRQEQQAQNKILETV